MVHPAPGIDPSAELQLVYEKGSPDVAVLKEIPAFEKWALQQFRIAAAGRCTLAAARAHVRAHADRMLKELAEELALIDAIANPAGPAEQARRKAREHG